MKNFFVKVFYVAITIAIMAVFGVCLAIGFNKEIDRQEKQRKYMCDYYAEAINKHYGHDVCPPTPQG